MVRGTASSTSTRLGSEPLLTATEEVELGRLAEAGALAQDRLEHATLTDEERTELESLAQAGTAALDRLVAANTRLVLWVTGRRYWRMEPLTFDDLVGEGLTGLVRAVHKWDHTRGIKLSTYAVPWIISVQNRAHRKATGLPERIYLQRRHINRCRGQLTASLGRAPTPTELAAAAGLAPHRIETLEAYGSEIALLDRPLTADATVTFGDRMAAATDPEPDPEAADAVAALLTTLPARQRRVLELHFGLAGNQPCDVPQIARLCGVSRTMAARTLEAALDTLRAAAAAGSGAPDPAPNPPPAGGPHD